MSTVQVLSDDALQPQVKAMFDAQAR